MRSKLVALIFVALTSVIVAEAQRVTVTERKVTYKRPKSAPEYKRTFTVAYPVVKAQTAALSRKIERVISYKAILDLDIKTELDKFGWLDEAGYSIEYNKNGILSVALNIEGSAAYPSGVTRYVVVDTATARRLRPSDSFQNLPGLIALINERQKAEIAEAIQEIKNDPEDAETDTNELFQDRAFRQENLDGYLISDYGVTFIYEYQFPHVIRALEPAGQYTFGWDEIRPFVRKGSLLERALR
jgi:hypothetical protein